MAGITGGCHGQASISMLGKMFFGNDVLIHMPAVGSKDILNGFTHGFIL
jgi:hypothetical protein